MLVCMERIIFIGDIHGYFDELMKLLEKIKYSKGSDRLILLGDLVDRGPNSLEVVNWARTNKIECVRGNHDDRYLQIDKQVKWHKRNPGEQKPRVFNHVEKMGLYSKLGEENLAWIESLPIYIKIPEIQTIAVHAGIKPGVEPEICDPNTMMHIRFLADNNKPAFLDKKNGFSAPQGSYFWADKFDLPWNVVYGHHVWNLTEPKQHEGYYGHICYGIDTGICFGGRLTAMIVDMPQQNTKVEFLKPKFHQVELV